ncbi:site-specific integrase [Salmonella enterica]
MGKITFDLLKEDYYLNKQLRTATIWSYDKVTQTFVRFMDKDVCPEDITRRDVLMWRDSILRQRKLSTWTWNNKVRHLRALYAWGIKNGLLATEENPFHGVVVRPEQKLKKVLTESQVDQVYAVMERFERMENQGEAPPYCRCSLVPVRFWRVVLDMLQFSGMRQNQLIHLRLKDICFEQNIITLRVESAKNYRENRIPLISVLRPGLLQLADELRLRGMRPEDQFFNVGFLTGRHEDGGMSVQTLRGFFRRLSRECHFNVSPHRFRHTIATELMKLPDSNLQTVKNLLGHSSISTTLEYVDGNVDTVREALEARFAAKKKKKS